MLNEHFLKKHLVFDHGIKDGAFICEICPKTFFLSETGYTKHVEEKHNSASSLFKLQNHVAWNVIFYYVKDMAWEKSYFFSQSESIKQTLNFDIIG